jgi:crooked neck
MYARFEVRRLDLPAARKVLGTAIGMCPKEALFKGYIQLEFDVRSPCFLFHFSPLTACFPSQLREFDRVRTLYEKHIEVC